MAGHGRLTSTRRYGEEDGLNFDIGEDMSTRNKVEVILEDHTGFHLPMTARLRPRTPARKIEIAIRRHLSEYVKPTHKILLFDGGILLHPDERVEPPPNLTYRIVEIDTATVEMDFPVRFRKAGRKYYQQPNIGQEALASDIATGMTVDEIRRIFACKMGVADRNTIVVSAEGGTRPGPLEGGHWQLNKLETWCCSGVNIDVCAQPHYMILRCWGKDYLYQPENSNPCGGELIIKLKAWLADSLLTKVKDRGSSDVRIAPEDIVMLQNGEQLRGDMRAVWGSTLEFTLPGPAAKQFLAEEDWLWPFKFSCEVCAEKKSCEEMALQVTDGCKHKPEVCTECLSQWISSCLDMNSWQEVTCPTCSNSMSYGDVKAHATEKQFNRYDTLAMRDCLANIPDFYWCLEKGCKSGQIHRPITNTPACPKTLLECNACGGRQCTHHGVKWHDGETCQEYENSTKVKAEKASEALIKTTAKQCPKCSRKVTKYVGCNHITCVCGQQWCYLCLEPWVLNSNSRILNCVHADTCPERMNGNPFGMEDFVVEQAFRHGVAAEFARPRWNLPPGIPHLPHLPHHPRGEDVGRGENIGRFPGDDFINGPQWQGETDGIAPLGFGNGHRNRTPSIPPPPPPQPPTEPRQDGRRRPGRPAPTDNLFARRIRELHTARPQPLPVHRDEIYSAYTGNTVATLAEEPGQGRDPLAAAPRRDMFDWSAELERPGRRHDQRMAHPETYDEPHRRLLMANADEVGRRILETNEYREHYTHPAYEPQDFHRPGTVQRNRMYLDEPLPRDVSPAPARRPRVQPNPMPEPITSRTRNATRRQTTTRQNNAPAGGTTAGYQHANPVRRSPRANRAEAPDGNAPGGGGPAVRRPQVQLTTRNPSAMTESRTRRRYDVDYLNNRPFV